MNVLFSEAGLSTVKKYISDCETVRKKFLGDKQDDTHLPTVEDIRSDIPVFLDEEGYYYNNWGITDDRDMDRPLVLEKGTDFEVNPNGNPMFRF